MEEEGEVETFVFKVEVCTESNRGYRSIYPCLVFLGNHAIAVDIAVTDTSETGSFLIGMVVYLLLAFENTVGNISYLRTDSMTDNRLHTVAAKGTAGRYRGRHIDYLIVIMRDIGGDIIFETAFGLVAVTQLELYTHIIHRTGVHPLRCAFTHHSDARHQHENIFRLLVEPVERTVERLLEEREVETDVGLRGGLPFDIVVAQLKTAETGRKDSTSIGAGNVVGCTIGLTAALVHAVVGVVDGIACGGIDVLVTRLSP